MGRNFWAMEEITVFSLAKINLGLEVRARREDGFHEIITLFQSIDLSDRLKFKRREDGKIILQGNRPDVPWDENNLIFKAALKLREFGPPSIGVEIEVDKNIPPGRGLAGGSSNAALTIFALNNLWELNLPAEKMLELSSSLGADVPFFFYGGLCLGQGKGEKIDPLPDFPPLWVLLVIPNLAISTAFVYEEIDRQIEFLTSKNKASKIIQFLELKDYSFLQNLENDLELVAFKLYPQLAGIKQEIKQSGARLSLMSGSGSAVFGLFDDKSLAQKAAGRLGGQNRIFLGKTVGRDLYRRKLITGA
ncbi:MAG TPA: 4-(cytidine 5'-diphospho)-2-C-methyl-D-erythritol kinase [Candidatus Aminicenantes bacterium]|nr:4-(cytidine 5'-diphospho)-2-C-methyl-D-erythritol kinase [Candidatus Aminicenantes bacterium]